MQKKVNEYENVSSTGGDGVCVCVCKLVYDIQIGNLQLLSSVN